MTNLEPASTHRNRLIDDLQDALAPGSAPSTLAVFTLSGAGDYRRVFGRTAGDQAVACLADELEHLIRPAGVCYQARQDELCALIRRTDVDARAMLRRIESALNHRGAEFLITAHFGAALLPDEASHPIEALMLAGERLRARTEARGPGDVLRPHAMVTRSEARGQRVPDRLSLAPSVLGAVSPEGVSRKG